MKKAKQDLTGMVFGKLTVLHQVEDYIEPSGVHRDRWLCECSCEKHTIKAVLGNNLRKPNGTRSCGCLHIGERRKYNHYEERNGYVVGFTSNTNEEFYLDLSNYELAKQYCWYAHTYNDGYRRIESKDNNTGKIISMTQLFGCKGYDHCNRNTFDNRMENLRPATTQENARNISISKANSSGIIGVGWNKEMQQWHVRIGVDYNSIELGFFTDKTDAIVARLNAELKYFGKEFAPQRHLFEQYGIIEREDSTNDANSN
jgi:hypothetical protein